MPIPTQPVKSRRRRLLFVLLSLGLGMTLAGILVEVAFRWIEAREQAQTSIVGAYWIDDPRWG